MNMFLIINIGLGFLLYHGVRLVWYRDSDFGKDAKTRLLLGVVIAVLLTDWARVELVALYGSHQFGSLWEKREYEALYYVNFYTDRNDTTAVGAKGRIWAFIQEYEHSVDPDNEETVYEREYHLLDAQLEDGTILTFEGICCFENLVPGERSWLEDDDENMWLVQLTSRQVDENEQAAYHRAIDAHFVSRRQ